MLSSSGRLIDLDFVCGDASQADTPTPGLYQVPIKRRQGGTPVIDVVFNENQTFEMLWDTGASSTALTSEVAKALALVPEGAILVNTASENGVSMATSRVDSVTVSDITATDLVVGISPSLEIGLLGQDFFGNYDITIKEDVIELRDR